MRNTSPFRKQQSQQVDGVMTVAEASRFLRLDPRTVRTLFDEGDIRGNRAGRAIRLSRRSVFEWCDRNPPWRRG